MRWLKILPFLLLALQIAIPWSVPHYVTQDGPSHLYTAVVARNLIFHPHSDFSNIYRFNPYIVTNWVTTIFFNAADLIAGNQHAEKLVTSFCLIVGFLAFSYALQTWTPVANFLLQTWFLGVGFYNFYLGMALCPALVVYWIRHPRRTPAIAATLAVLFLIHPIAAGIAMLAMMSIAVWIFFKTRKDAHAILRVAVASMPAIAMMVWFATQSGHTMQFRGVPDEDWLKFPMQLFTTAPGVLGSQIYLWPVIALPIVVSIFLTQRREWVIPALALAVVYVIAPSGGFGGSFVKVRVAWALFIFGSIAIYSVDRFHRLRPAFAIYVSIALAANLFATWQHAHESSAQVEQYLASAQNISRGARIARIHYLDSAPLYHLDAYIAVRCGCVDLSDYQAANGIFPVVFRPIFTQDQQMDLWSLEGPSDRTGEVLSGLFAGLPAGIEYVIVAAAESWPKTEAERRVAATLDSRMRLVRKSGIARVYGLE